MIEFRPAVRSIITEAEGIIGEYEKMGLSLTLRQLYYQFVSRGRIQNCEREYKRLGTIINDARMAGLIDWNSIEDRTRFLRQRPHWESPAEIIRTCADQYHTDWWSTQPYHVEVWVEKDALVGVIESACNPLDVPFFSCRGYTSQSEMHVAAMRLLHYSRRGQEVRIIHLGDHDPSGKDMTRDILDRLRVFMLHHGGDVEVERIALTMEQVREYNPPPNPAKVTDSRAAAYIAEFGDESWELDALQPDMLVKLIQSTISKYVDVVRMKDAKADENRGRVRLVELADEEEGNG
jgi:hypothetical protein